MLQLKQNRLVSDVKSLGLNMKWRTYRMIYTHELDKTIVKVVLNYMALLYYALMLYSVYSRIDKEPKDSDHALTKRA